MVDEVADLLTDRSPLPLLYYASGLIEITEPKPLDRIRGTTPSPTADELFASFVESGFPELELLAQAGDLFRPGLVPTRLGPRPTPKAPSWMHQLGDARPTAAALHQHILGDGDNILVGWEWPDGTAAAAVAYIDHNLGTMVKDAFFVDGDVPSLQATYEEILEPGMTITPLDLADARARIEPALDLYGHTIDAPESETWPATRPFLQWVVGLLPDGGTGYERPDWPETRRERLLDDFTSSPFGDITGMTRNQVADLADPLIWFGCDYGPGDPLRWSPVAVEIVLTDWYPRKVMGLTETEQARVADVLAGFVRYAHHERNIPAALTTQTLGAIDYWRDDALGTPFNDAGDGHSPSVLDLDDPEAMDLLVESFEATVIDLVGGPANYDNLTDDPLPDIAFDWATIPQDVHQPTGRTLERLDRWATDLFDPEVRTIARAVLAAVVTTDPATFKRSDDTDGLAAAILAYLFQRLTDRFSADERRQLPWEVDTLKSLAAATGVTYSRVTSRRKTVANVIDRSDLDWSPILHSTQRLEAIDAKRQITEWRALG